ncbi:hypothetical protein TNCV_668671 [Trichonephila clavipes]|nr:hypothetical protein TNCV_668671 [Trichonephila clavipes]
MTPELASPSPNYHTTPTEGSLSFRQIQRSSLSYTGLEWYWARTRGRAVHCSQGENASVKSRRLHRTANSKSVIHYSKEHFSICSHSNDNELYSIASDAWHSRDRYLTCEWQHNLGIPGSFTMREKDVNRLVPGPDYKVVALELPNKLPGVPGNATTV